MLNGFRIPFWLGLCMLLAVVLFFWEGHSGHILAALSYLLFLLCPLMHLLSHRGQGKHGGTGDH